MRLPLSRDPHSTAPLSKCPPLIPCTCSSSAWQPVFGPQAPPFDTIQSGLPASAAVPTSPGRRHFPSKRLQRVGLEANGLVRAARSQIDMAEAGVVGAAAYPNPQVTFMGGPQHARIPSANPATYIAQFTVAQTIENPFLRSARIGSAEAGVEASRASLRPGSRRSGGAIAGTCL